MNILIPPRFSLMREVKRAFASCPITDFLVGIGASPLCPLYSTEVMEKEGISKSVRLYLNNIDGVFLQGGNDIDPAMYGQENSGSLEVETVRDLFEIEVIQQARARQIPIFGICRGFQILNVCLGGTLIQHLCYSKWDKHFSTSGAETDFCESKLDCVLDHYHPIELSQGGQLHSLLKTTTLQVPSHHHQGIGKLASLLEVEAVSPDGLVEAAGIRSEGILAVQWHPESDKNSLLTEAGFEGDIIRYWYESFVVGRAHL